MRNTIKGSIFILLLLFSLIPSSALSFELLSPYHAKWFCDDIPVKYWINYSQIDSDLVSEVMEGFSHWEDVSNTLLEFSYEGSTTKSGYNFYDGENVISFNDPDGDLPYGVLAATSTIMLENYTYTNDTRFYQFYDTDIVFNDGIDFGTSEEADSYWCSTSYDIESIATHEIGHMIGLDHVSDPSSTMYPEIGPCDTSYSSLSEDDKDGIRFIYDPDEFPAADFMAEPRRGESPLTVHFTDLSEPESESLLWKFGDKRVSNDKNPTHTYDEPGIYTVTMTTFASGCYDTEEKRDFIEVMDAERVRGHDESGCSCSTKVGDEKRALSILLMIFLSIAPISILTFGFNQNFI